MRRNDLLSRAVVARRSACVDGRLWVVRRGIGLAVGSALGVWVVCGCAKAPETVHVVLSQVPAEAVSAAPQAALAAAPAASLGTAEMVVPALAERNLYAGGAMGQAQSALATAREDQERSFRQLRERMSERAVRELAPTEQNERDALAASIPGMENALRDRLRGVFDEGAPRAGTLRKELSVAEGFPDPDPRSLRQAAKGDELGARRLTRAVTARKGIQEHDAAYRRTVDGLIAGLLDEIRDRQTKLEANILVRRQSREMAAEAEARQVTTGLMTELRGSGPNPNRRLAPVAGARASVRGASPLKEPKPGRPDALRDGMGLREQVTVFAALRGYRLTWDVRKGRDATQEFLAWRNRYVNGR